MTLVKSEIYLHCDGSSGNIELERDFANALYDCFELFKIKQRNYGATNISALGSKGVFVRMWDKVSRLRNLLFLDLESSLDDESIEDTYQDLANYAIISLLVKRGLWPQYKNDLVEVGDTYLDVYNERVRVVSSNSDYVEIKNVETGEFSKFPVQGFLMYFTIDK